MGLFSAIGHMVTRELVEMDVTHMVRSELAAIATPLFSTVNKRIKRLIDSDTVSPALEGLIRKRGVNPRFSARGKDLASLQREYAEALAWYNLNTSTVTGARQFTKKLQAKIGERVKDKEYVKSVFDLMHSVAERIPVMLAGNMIGTQDILNNIVEQYTADEITEFMSDADVQESIINEMVQEMINALVEEQMMEEEDIGGTAGEDGGFLGGLFDFLF